MLFYLYVGFPFISPRMDEQNNAFVIQMALFCTIYKIQCGTAIESLQHYILYLCESVWCGMVNRKTGFFVEINIEQMPIFKYLQQLNLRPSIQIENYNHLDKMTNLTVIFAIDSFNTTSGYCLCLLMSFISFFSFIPFPFYPIFHHHIPLNRSFGLDLYNENLSIHF